MMTVTVADRVFGFAAVEEKPRLLVAVLVEIMQKQGVGLRRQLIHEFIQAAEQRKEVGFWIRGGHGSDLLIKLVERHCNVAFNCGHLANLDFDSQLTTIKFTKLFTGGVAALRTSEGNVSVETRDTATGTVALTRIWNSLSPGKVQGLNAQNCQGFLHSKR